MRLIRFFGVADTGQNWRSKFISRPRVGEMVDHVERAAPLLLDWPDGLHSHIDAQRRRATEGVSLAAEFGPFLTRLRQAFDDPHCEELIEAVRQHIAGPTHRILTKPSSFYHTASEQPIVLSAAAAAKLLGLTSRTVVRMIATGELQGESRRAGRRSAYFVESSCLGAFVRKRARALTETEVAEFLGISTSQVGRLRRDHLLASVSAFGSNSQEHRYLPEAIASFVEQLTALATMDLHDTVSLAAVARMRTVTLVNVIKQIMAGLLPVSHDLSCVDCKFDGLQVQKSDLFKLRIDPSGLPRMSVRQAAKTIGVAVRMIPLLVRSGCLDGSLSGNSLARHGVSLRSVKEFPQRFATSRRLASRHRTSSRVMISRLRSANISPILASDPRRGISAVWRQSDAASLKTPSSPDRRPKASNG
jgi:predicted DNA-binding transcriptional regulator AlpA